MPEEALDSSTNDNYDITSITRSVLEEFYEPDLMRVVCGDGASSLLCSDEWQNSRNKQKDFMENVNLQRKDNERLQFCL
jgi:hypothetical protein